MRRTTARTELRMLLGLGVCARRQVRPIYSQQAPGAPANDPVSKPLLPFLAGHEADRAVLNEAPILRCRPGTSGSCRGNPCLLGGEDVKPVPSGLISESVSVKSASSGIILAARSHFVPDFVVNNKGNASTQPRRSGRSFNEGEYL